MTDTNAIIEHLKAGGAVQDDKGNTYEWGPWHVPQLHSNLHENAKFSAFVYALMDGILKVVDNQSLEDL